MKQYYKASTWAIYAILRFFLASIVFISHLKWFTDSTVVSNFIQLLGGKAAVIGFLVISGISVGYSYKKNSVDYLERRFMRIYPVYFFGVMFASILMFALPSPYELPKLTMVASGWKTAIANLLFGQGFISITIPYNGPLWTISIEMLFYVLTPFFSRLHTRILVLLVLISMYFFLFPLDSNLLYGYIAIMYAWPWLIGFILSVKQKHKTAILLCLLGIPVIVFSKITNENLSWITYVITVLIIFLSNNFSLPNTFKKAFNFLGDISYPLYVFHMPIAISLFYLIGKKSVYIYIIYIILITIPLYYIFDKWLKNIFWKPLVTLLKRNLSTKPIFQKIT